MATSANYDNAARRDPYLAYAFSVKIGSDCVAGFSEVSGLSIETEVETLRVGGVNHRDLQLAGPSKYPSRLVLKRGMGDIAFLWDWYSNVLQGMIERRDVAIYLNNDKGGRLRGWIFQQACPIKWTGPELRASTSAIAFESIELVHRGVAP